ncbi:hypothetical protein HN51_008786 [Arachis hypogaea]|uniref:DUF789 family protein n=2 Tax=Arachis TaxID=3817 RepID=A0A445D212_ARAHY|nr:uncharacterized protein LOC107490701 isoform X1 [Arachis duranensis]XP_025701166.1 uncharacterized protein LOC112802260 isoform X1 [Arachis hypogaea]QHO43139.1 uncharacterized protein DS421_5g160260 [Arachis hypogaea]RYR57237.1 hypothetical protein Ahy_A05g022970 [Arachis hypogaea]
MLGTALQFGGVGGDDRFYIPVKARKNLNHRKQAQRTKGGDGGEVESGDSASKAKLVAFENSKFSEESLYPLNMPPPSSSSSSSSSVDHGSNIDRFIESTTPLVRAQYFSKTTMRGWKTCDVEYQSYFALNDLWESFKEWSAYGAGVPLVLDQRDSVIQYYVPYLSAIQLYGRSAKKSSPKSRYSGEDSDGDYYKDSSSDGSSDSDFGKRTEPFPAQRSSQHRGGNVSIQMSGLSVNDKLNAMQEGFSSDDSEGGNTQDLLFEYFDQDPPYSREPLADKILDLARHYPSLKSMRSCDILPASWMAVAWYPIYRIPTGPTLKDLDACFLTYHSLHTPLTGNGGTQAPILVYPNEMEDGVPKISLPTFAMASYKLKGSIWMQNRDSESQIANSLLQAAGNWLRLLQVNHPDYQFFVSHGTYRR